ncbi:MAG: 6-phosphogluconolactonase [Solirubrobacterales bacterium]|nr:6-phosphogluconolactonase [Solirubrobacterales bacterium]
MSVEIEVVPEPARACAAMMVGAAADSGHIVLAGGSTPRAANEEFVAAVQAAGVDLTGTTFWFGDERCVPPDDDRSNFKMVRQSLLAPLGEDAIGRVVRMAGELGHSEGAEAYERELTAAGPPNFDLLLLGIGPDGHTASMFPGQESLSERSRLIVGVPEAGLEPFVPRISMTLPAIGLARQVVVLASGDSKADAIATAFGPNAKPRPEVPSSMLAVHAKQVTVLTDPAAAARL